MGLKVHDAVLARGVKVTGATVHFVDAGTDTGPIILQKAGEGKRRRHIQGASETCNGESRMEDPSGSHQSYRQ